MNCFCVEIDSQEYRLFEVNIGNGIVVTCAEEKLDNKIQEKIEQERYHEIRHIDEMYGYVIPQDVLDTNDEQDIIDSIVDVYEEE